MHRMPKGLMRIVLIGVVILFFGAMLAGWGMR